MTDETGSEIAGERLISGDARTCPWCSSVVAPGVTKCQACGAAVAQRDELAGVEISGVTEVDPALRDRSALGGLFGVQAAIAGTAAPYFAHEPLAGPPDVFELLEIGGTAVIDASAVGQPTDFALETARQLDEQEAAQARTADQSGETLATDMAKAEASGGSGETGGEEEVGPQ